MDHLFGAKSLRLIISELTLVEIQSVFAIKVRTGVASHADYTAMRTTFRTDIARHRLHVEPIAEPDRRRAVRLIAKYGLS